MTIEKRDSLTAGQLLVEDENGVERPISQEEAQVLIKRNVPDGLNVPGYVPPSNKKRPIKNTQQPNSPIIHQPATVPQPQIPSQQPYYAYPQSPPPPGYAYPQQPQQPIQQVPPQPTVEKEPEKTLVPPTEMMLVDGAYHIFIDLAGVSKTDLNMIYDNGVLKIDGYRESSIEILKKELKKAQIQKPRKNLIKETASTIPEYLIGKFHYEYPFKRLVNEAEIKAEYKNGVLHVTLPHRTKGDQVNIPLM